ncbi:MAG: TM0106 family RecB-like putative nuclease [Proteobacteria bacterium]|nr:TM0106 family RecB-like putative nuclease [Pseudomonadota bacterium]
MKVSNKQVVLSASDLVGYLNCNHLSALDLDVVHGHREKPEHYDPLLELLRERGNQHEQAYLEHLQKGGFQYVCIDGVDISDASVNATTDAMKSGCQIIVQAAFRAGSFVGRADILRRIERSSNLGDWSYEIIDTKLSRETKGGSVLQLCLYADLLSEVQGFAPEHIYIVAPWSDYEPQAFRFNDYAAYYRKVKAQALDALVSEGIGETYPEPKSHCDICRWRNDCDLRRRNDDHLCLVANISKNQISELKVNGIANVKALAELPEVMPFTPQKGSVLTYEKSRDQANVQVRARETGELTYDIKQIVPKVGFSALPEPSIGDVFFDIESDPFVGEHGLEYLLGYSYFENEKHIYSSLWGFERAEEKAIFERLIDDITARREIYPDMHIYHFAPYEPAALKRLMGRYATREDEVDNLLRGEVFVDLLSAVRNAMYAGVESYSIKKLEPFFGFQRKVVLHDANVALTKLTSCIELNDTKLIDDATKKVVEGYNADDCFATHALRDWLETLRRDLIAEGHEIPRPPIPEPTPLEDLNERAKKVLALIGKLTQDVPVDRVERSEEQHARWLLAYLLDWHRREEKAVWWEFFRLRDLTPDDLVSEKAAISRLSFLETVESTKSGIPIDRYAFEQQDTDVKEGDKLIQNGGDTFGTAEAICKDSRTIDIKKSKKTKGMHPEAVYSHLFIRTNEQANSIMRIAGYVAETGIEGSGDYISARELLLRKLPEISDNSMNEEGETILQSALRVAKNISSGVLPMQGPPGTGKSYTGARMICALVKQGKKVGITANSHKVIRNLIDKVIEAAIEDGTNINIIQKPKDKVPDQNSLVFAKTNEEVFTALSSGTAQVAGGTHFLWSRAEAASTLDVLFIDEAAQMSLANVLAVCPAATSVILLGDPQQLDQPTQGSHPDGTGVSSLDHILGGAQTISPEQGLFLKDTWRLSPDICAFNSELFYDSKLSSVAGCDKQIILSESTFVGAGLRYCPVDHSGNTSSSIEEAEVVQKIVQAILASNTTWTDRDGIVRPVSLDDILIIAPYNAQVFEIQQRIQDARVGTVDKFQGQEAPIAIYSMATSSYKDAPRGMEFLYSGNRLNVAISRAQCLAILVASPQVFEAECKMPRQMQLVNAFCRYLEMAESITV